MEYKDTKSLELFVTDVEKSLLDEANRLSVTYPQESIAAWDSAVFDGANELLLSSVSDDANVYAIFTAAESSDLFSLRYIGKTTRRLARQRLRNHLIKKSDETGAKLDRVVEHVRSGGSVKISWVKIDPESLRNYVEEELIARHQEADWNRGNG
jgi:hypothetical protein